MPTGIPYATDTLELTSGCTAVSEGCEHCWARCLAEGRLKRFYPAGFNKVAVQPERLNLPLRWRKPRMVFVCSRSDLFHPDIPFTYVYKVFQIFAQASRHIFLVLTKRPMRLSIFSEGYCSPHWPSNVWPGVSVENQKRADERLPLLAQIPAKIRFVSLEPLLGPVDLRPWLRWVNLDSIPIALRNQMGRRALSNGINWVIVGGESGRGYRPMEMAWLEKVVADCRDAGVPVWVKQASSLRPGQQGDIPNELWTQEWPNI